MRVATTYFHAPLSQQVTHLLIRAISVDAGLAKWMMMMMMRHLTAMSDEKWGLLIHHHPH